jgi:hypothetical protein
MNDALRFELADALEDARRCQTDGLRNVGLAGPAIRLQMIENLKIEGVDRNSV